MVGDEKEWTFVVVSRYNLLVFVGRVGFTMVEDGQGPLLATRVPCSCV